MPIVPWGQKPGGGGAGAVSSVSNADGTLTVSPTTGAVVASIPTSVALPGSPTTTTQAAADNTTKVATTAFVTAATTGTAGGDLTGTYPNPTVGANKVTLPKFVQTGTKGQLLTSQGGSTNASYQTYGTQVFDAGASVSNTLTQTTLLSAGAITNAYPAFVNAGDRVRIIAGGTYLNNTAATQNFSLALFYGSTSLFNNAITVGTASANVHLWTLDVTLICTTVSGTVGVLLITGYEMLSGTTAALTMAAIQNASSVLNGGKTVGSLVTNIAQNLDLQGTMSTSTATGTMVCSGVVLEYIPKLT